MIVSIDSSIPSFKGLSFQPGLNVLLSDSKDVNKSGKTRNSAGKTSFVLILDFLLGSKCDKKSLFRSKNIVDASFRGEFIIGGKKISVERSGSCPTKIFILEGHESLQIYIKHEKATQRNYVSLADWKTHLGSVYFGLPDSKVNAQSLKKYRPSVRAIMKYFLRSAGDGGFDQPNKSSKNQQNYSWQTCISYIFGLDWTISQQLQELRDKEKVLDNLKQVAGEGLVNDLIGTVADLRPKVVLSQKRAETKRGEIANFQVLETYRDLTNEASSYHQEMQKTSKLLVSLQETLKYLSDSFVSEQATSSVNIEEVYRASGVELPEVALRKFEDVKSFEQSVVENRKIHLRSEIDKTNRDISDAQDYLSKSGHARKRALIALEGKGAFSDLVELQKELSKLEAEHAILLERFDAAEAMEREKSELKVGRIELQRRLQADYNTHSDILDALILRIAELIAALYDQRVGRFVIDATENGPEFDIKIAGDRGTGIRNMEIFCLDIALFENVRSRFGGTGFLVHDSHLFDGVDARQIATAIEIGQQVVGNLGQYIVTLNSDIYESLSFSKEFEKETVVIDTRLSDEGDSGGLFGFRFD